MKATKRNITKIYIALAVIGLALLSLWFTFTAAMPRTPGQQLNRAWRLANDVNSYSYRSSAIQTNHPSARLDNAGRSSLERQIWAEGIVDRPNKTMTMKLSLGANQQPIELKIENGQAFGKTEYQDEWVAVDNPADVFAPNGDPLGYLTAAENIQYLGSGQAASNIVFDSSQSPLSDSYQQYTFDINGVKYAGYMRQQLEETLRANGELPAGVSLRLADQYINMKAYGEIWIDTNGLPVRQVIHMEFPTEQGDYNNVEADITTTFSRWDTESLNHKIAWVLPRIVKDPSILVDDPLSLLPNINSINVEDVQVLSIEISLILLLAAFILFAYSRFGSRALYAIVTVLVISSMLVSPLIESNRVLAMSEKQQDKIAEVDQQKSEQLAQEQILSSLQASDFNPMLDPLADSSVNAQSIPANVSQPGALFDAASAQASQLQTTCANPVPGDTDCNGNPDNDGDGLTDEVEVLRLGTDPNLVDTDGDRISDKVEVQGFNIGGPQWYLDPLNYDSNLDGRSDFLECNNLVDIASDGTWPIAQLGSACENSDGDNTPDVFDFDDDNDGVPDSLDSAPTYTGDLSATTHSDVSLNLSNFVTDKTLLVDFELRPVDPNDLWQTGNVYDWPSNDRAGQITRVFDTTFADVSTSSNPPSDLSSGDVMVTPLLQIKMSSPASNTGNPSSGLPVKSTFSGDITTAALNDWLDSDMLSDYSIDVSQDDSDGSLYAYVPLTQLNDPVGDAPVAWAGRMVYLPNTATWGQSHQVKLIWLVTMLVDTCDTTGLSDPKDQEAYSAWCEGTTHWVTNQQVVQTYYEDFKLTGLNVTEEHGSKTAVIAQTDALSTHYERNLWQLSNGLQGTFITGDQISSGNRFTIEEIKNRFDAGTTSYATGAPELWGIPNNKLVVREASSVDQVTSFKDLEANVNALLRDMYLDAATGSIVTLMFAREDSSRSVMLEETNYVSVNGNAISIDLGATSDNPVFTYASLNWAPYRIDVSGWHGYDVVDYLLLDAFTSALKTQLTPADLQTMASGETINDENLAKEGALLFAQNYYLAISRGLGSMVAVNGQPLSDDLVIDGDYALNGQEPVAQIVRDMVDLMATFVENERDLMVNGSVVANSDFETTHLRSLLLESVSNGKDVSYFKLGSKATFAAIEKVAKKLFKTVRQFSEVTPTVGKIAKKGGTVLALTGTGIKLLGPVLFVGMTQRQSLVVAASLDTASNALAAFGEFTRFNKLKKLMGNLDKTSDYAQRFTLLKGIHALKSTVSAGGIISLITSTVASIGLMTFVMVSGHIAWGSIQANLLLTETIATITVNIVMAVISFTAAGALFVAVLGLIDSLFGLVCDALNVDPNTWVRKWVCGGFTGAITQGISHLLYDYYTPYDVSNLDRLDVVYDSVQVIKSTANEGFVAGNAIKINATISNTISMAEPNRLIIRTSYLNSDLTLDRERLKDIGKKSTFSYSFNAAPPFHPEDALSLNGTNWSGDTAVYTLNQTVTLTAGLNSTPSIYMTEAYDLATIECWGFVGADEKATCNENKELKGSNNTDVSGLFVFDVLPTSISGFPAFFNKLKSQRDADGDGLPSSGSGLVDPNDTTWDTDQDGLSDYWEMNHAGFNPQTADSDSDGLYDYWEAFYQTQPALQDSDSDGLTDGQEFFHSNVPSAYLTDDSIWSGGWSIVYGYSGNVGQQTWVSADPQSVDFDADNILDSLEYTYGYNPNLPSIENVLTLNAKPDANTYLPGSTINYTATVKNELDNRVAYGLLETEFPVDVLQQQQLITALYPQVETGFSGSLTVPNANQTTTRDLVVRAGALITAGVADAIFDLPFDGVDRNTVFRDITAGHHDFTCTACPTINGSTVTFNGSQSLTRGHDADFDRSIFSVSAWVKPTAYGGTIYEDTGDGMAGIMWLPRTMRAVPPYLSTALRRPHQPAWAALHPTVMVRSSALASRAIWITSLCIPTP